jgi:hypothetical protein
MSYKLTPVENNPTERHEIATVINTAYTDDNNAYYHTSFPSTTLPERINGSALRWGQNLIEPNLWHFKLEHPSTGEIMSYSRWEMPEDLVTKLKLSFGMPKPSEEELATFQRDYQAGCENGVPKGLNKAFTDREEKRLDDVKGVAFPKCDHISELSNT